MALLARHARQRRLVWMFGSPRSGSTWLLKLLAEAPEVVPVNEPLIGLHLAPFTSALPGSRAEDFDENDCTFNRIGRQRQARGYFFSDQHRDDWLPALRNLLLARFRPERGQLFAIQEPNGSQAADLIISALPHSRLLFLLRDGRDVVDSLLAAFMEGGWMTRQYPVRGIQADDRMAFVSDAAHKWVWQTSIVQSAYAQHEGPKRLVRYEELRRSPVEQLAAIFGWLGLTTDASRAVERHRFEGLPRGPREFNRQAEPGGWKRNLSADERELVEQVAGAKLRELGYD